MKERSKASAVLLIICCIFVLSSCTPQCKTGEALITGIYIRTEESRDGILFELNGQDTLAVLRNQTGTDDPFRKISSGDRVWVKYPCVPFPEDEEILTIPVLDAGKDHSRAPFHSEIPTEYLEKLEAIEPEFFEKLR